MLFSDSESNRRFVAAWDSQVSELSAEGAEARDVLLPTVDDARFPGGLVPREDARHGGVLCIYLVAASDDAWNQAVPIVRGAIGVTLTSFRGRSRPPNMQDHFERWLSNEGVHRLGVMYIPRRDTFRVRECLLAVKRLRKVLSIRPADNTAFAMPTSSVLRQFDYALTLHDEGAARAHLSYLRENLRLDALNLTFLEVQLMATLGHWDALAGHRDFRSLIHARRPPAVTAALAEALSRSHLSPWPGFCASPSEAISVFKQKIEPFAGRLFDNIQPYNARVAIASVLAELSSLRRGEVVDQHFVKRVLDSSASWTVQERDVLDVLVNYANIGQLANPVGFLADGCSSATVGTDFEASQQTERKSTANALLEINSPAVEVTPLLVFEAVTAACKSGTLLDASLAVRTYSSLAIELRNELNAFPAFADMWRAVQRLSPVGIQVTSWGEWVRGLGKMSVQHARELAVAGYREWDNVSEFAPGDQLDELIKEIESVHDANRVNLDAGLPHLVRVLQEYPNGPAHHHFPLFRDLMDGLLIERASDAQSRDMVLNLFSCALHTTPNPVAYALLLRDVGDYAQIMSARGTIDWMIGILEAIAIAPRPDFGAASSVWDALTGHLLAFDRHMNNTQRMVHIDLANDVGFASPFSLAPEEAQQVHSDPLRDVRATVGVYSLNSDVAQRVSRYIRQLFPRVSVVIDQSLVATQSLSSLAERADVMVTYWQFAKHMATEAISRRRSAGRCSILAPTRGAASVVQLVRACLLELAVPVS